MLKIDPARKFRPKPERHSRRRHSDNCNLDSSNFFQDVRLNSRERIFRIGKFAGRFSFQQRVCGQDRHCRSLQRVFKRLNPPIKFMVADHPRVVFKMIEQIDH